MAWPLRASEWAVGTLPGSPVVTTGGSRAPRPEAEGPSTPQEKSWRLTPDCEPPQAVSCNDDCGGSRATLWSFQLGPDVTRAWEEHALIQSCHTRESRQRCTPTSGEDTGVSEKGQAHLERHRPRGTLQAPNSARRWSLRSCWQSTPAVATGATGRSEGQMRNTGLR